MAISRKVSRARKAKISVDDLLRDRDRGLTQAEQAKLHGVSVSTIARLWRPINEASAPAPAAPVEPPAASTPEDRRGRALATLERNMASENPAAANAAAKALLDEERKAEAAATYADAGARAARAWMRARAAKLGRGIRAAAASDPELAAAYAAAAATTASPDEREALAVLIETRYPELAACDA